MTSPDMKHYTVYQLDGLPIIGMLHKALSNPLKLVVDTSCLPGDIIATRMMGQRVLQVNHPDLVRHVLVDNHKNYKKSPPYIRFQSVGGMGLLTSYGDRWKRSRQKIQPLFNRKLITDNHYTVVNEVAEKYKQRWFNLTANGSAEINITQEMANITTEVIMKTVFGRDMDDAVVESLHQSYDILIEYLKNLRVIQSVDMRRVLCMPSYFKFKQAREVVYGVIRSLSHQYRSNSANDRHCMLALLIDAQKNDPEHFDDREIRDQCATMLFAGFETTSILLQWMWYVLDDEKEVLAALRNDICSKAPMTATSDSSLLSYEQVASMDYLTMVLKETLRVYPPFWVTGREPLEDDMWGDYKVKKGTMIALPQYALHHHSRWWMEPEKFIPERFSADKLNSIDDGVYFPFSLGPRACIGAFFAEMEAKTIMAKLVPLFDVKALNKQGNALNPAIALKLKHPLQVRISRAH